MTQKKRPRQDDAVPSEVARQIDENLKRLYSDVDAEGLPDDLMSLLEQLRQKDLGRSGDAR
ncbi:NepR family anti-sigma factor [Roseicitreum antarcticum]|jgi:hypothetical protein|uniref:Anti-sigma factor NepR domain-containing protein n=1 Tax=Roseicitreum antarcticum TaxID=564137 RepID=A0A1H2ZCE2_9RHOB|nr:NepR family anti-sigma factor [Roseicitreum antarcticum]SDX15007.1 hypothetical protein SAMN04488238_105327 [Roseicitreum antarcticum]